jgi:hypothetical protein
LPIPLWIVLNPQSIPGEHQVYNIWTCHYEMNTLFKIHLKQLTGWKLPDISVYFSVHVFFILPCNFIFIFTLVFWCLQQWTVSLLLSQKFISQGDMSTKTLCSVLGNILCL